MRKVIFVITVLVVCSAFSYSQGWVQQNSGVTHNINDIYFVNENTGFAVCSSFPAVMLKTTNSGTNWISITFPSTYQFKSIDFINQSTGFICGMSYNIFKTTNQGINWFNLNILVSGSFESIKFLNLQTGYIASANPKSAYIYKTTNSGINWALNYLYSGTIGFFDIEVLDSNNIIEAGGPCMRTTNGGINWHTLNFWGTDVSFGDEFTGYIIASADYYYKTTNKGINWVQTSMPYLLKGIKAISAQIVTACGNNGLIIKTTNGGSGWLSQLSGTNRRLNSVYFINSNTGWISGDSGIILKTTTGGVTKIQPVSIEIPASITLHQNYPNPFNPVTNIKFEIPKSGFVELKIFDVLGREVSILVNEQLSPGTYEVDWDALSHSSGVYYYKIISGEYVETKKMILIK